MAQPASPQPPRESDKDRLLSRPEHSLPPREDLQQSLAETVDPKVAPKGQGDEPKAGAIDYTA